jgi:NAD(P) transhydrogenase subunit alpha
MPAAWMQRQAAAVGERLKQSNIAIATALIPGRKAPILITEEMVKTMQPGSVIVDMAVEQGGNCALSELGKTVTKHGVHIIGQPNLAATVPTDSSALYARNVLDFLKLVVDKDGNFVLPADDDIVTACLLCTNGEIKRKN